MGQKDDMTIRFSGLKPGIYTYGFTLTNEFFDTCENDEIRGGNVKIDVKMERLQQMLMFEFSLEGEVSTICDRCLGEMTVPVAGSEKLCVRFSDTETSDDEDVVVLPENAFEIDLTQWLYEYVAVRIPLQHMHPEGECDPEVTKYIVESDENGEPKKENGARDEETDPRWEALRKLRGEE